MLISPMMGPILAMAISVNLHKVKLGLLGMQNVVMTMFICVGIGFVVRSLRCTAVASCQSGTQHSVPVIVHPNQLQREAGRPCMSAGCESTQIDVAYHDRSRTRCLKAVWWSPVHVQAGLISVPWITGETDFPTHEMEARTGKLTLLTGIVIATASGGGVALSVLSENSASLVGVAISAALLPPLVNAGLSWGIAALLPSYADKHHECALARLRICAAVTLLKITLSVAARVVTSVVSASCVRNTTQTLRKSINGCLVHLHHGCFEKRPVQCNRFDAGTGSLWMRWRGSRQAAKAFCSPSSTPSLLRAPQSSCSG